jgi:hypothetical protein
MNESVQKSKNISILGILVTILVTAGFVWAAMEWLNRNNEQLSKNTIQADEQNTFLNMRLISQAQKKYIQKDWNGDGNKTYAVYFVHLWTSVTAKGEPVPVNLIPREIGFATEIARALHGYYFWDLHDHVINADGTLKGFDYTKEWAVIALPALNGETGMLNFLADYSGNIYVNSAKYVPLQYPEDPARSGWKKIDSLEELKTFQKNVVYPE